MILNSDDLKSQVLKALRKADYYGRELGAAITSNGDGWSKNVRCPFHEDKNPSFGVNFETGAFKCFSCDAKGDLIDFHMRRHGLSFSDALADLATIAGVEIERRPQPDQKARSKIVATYDYTDEAGALLFQVVRLDPKSFRQRRPDGSGGWSWDMQGVGRVLYRLPDVLNAGEVLVVEGEKDADNLRALGFTATTNAGGAGKWEQQYTDSLTGKDLVLLPDNDEPGRKHMLMVAGALFSKARSVKILPLPDLLEKGDVSDFIASFSDRVTAAERLSIMIDNAAPWTPTEDRPKERPTDPPKKSPLDALRALAVKKEYIDMLGEEEWLFPNLVVKNQITVVIAKTGGGKSTIFYNYVSPYMVLNHEAKIFYLDCDSPVSDHKKMHDQALAMGAENFQWINPATIAEDKDSKKLIDILEEIAKAADRLDNHVFILDTLKKFIDMLDKKSVKPFFVLMRRLASLGATVILLGHANKYRDANGNLVFEGVQDIQSDADAMVIFEYVSAPDGIDVTTVIDPDKGAKVRGLYEPISFHIVKGSREVTLCKNVVAVPDWKTNIKMKLTEEEIEEKIREYLKGRTGDVVQGDIINELKKNPGMGYHRIREVINACAVHESEATTSGQIFYRSGNAFNQKRYSVIQN